ncbi:MAG: hypothetical protein HQK60_15840 [Deltaproteobacteria bacterium]|nr:hypothetical protein [Deltaproteobacteria bacterium]
MPKEKVWPANGAIPVRPVIPEELVGRRVLAEVEVDGPKVVVAMSPEVAEVDSPKVAVAGPMAASKGSQPDLES